MVDSVDETHVHLTLYDVRQHVYQHTYGNRPPDKSISEGVPRVSIDLEYNDKDSDETTIPWTRLGGVNLAFLRGIHDIIDLTIIVQHPKLGAKYSNPSKLDFSSIASMPNLEELTIIDPVGDLDLSPLTRRESKLRSITIKCVRAFRGSYISFVLMPNGRLPRVKDIIAHTEGIEVVLDNGRTIHAASREELTPNITGTGPGIGPRGFGFDCETEPMGYGSFRPRLFDIVWTKGEMTVNPVLSDDIEREARTEFIAPEPQPPHFDDYSSSYRYSVKLIIEEKPEIFPAKRFDSVILPELPDLRSVTIENGTLQELDLSPLKETRLEELVIAGNGLKQLDLSVLKSEPKKVTLDEPNLI
ncbi:MAG: hypothetical protein ACFFED_18615 [Candidatus Thorarchaeota archaeon]